MVNILYSISCEGRGHSSRSYEIIRRLLINKHRITILTGGDSLEPIKEALRNNKNVKIIKIPGYSFAYDKKGNINYFLTGAKNAKLIFEKNKYVNFVEQILVKQKIDFVISDFEPFAPRAAKNKNIPFLTIDNQHRFIFEKQSRNKIGLRYFMSYLFTKNLIRIYHPYGKKCIITSSFIPKLSHSKSTKNNVLAVGPIIRFEIEQLKNKLKRKNFILVYVKPQFEKLIVPVIESTKHQDFIMYVKNNSEYASKKNITYKKNSISNFADDFANCKAVISTAGEQLMSEALFLRKPVFFIPESGSYEQKFNAELIKKNNFGDFCEFKSFSDKKISLFISKNKFYIKNLKKFKIENNADKILTLIEATISDK